MRRNRMYRVIFLLVFLMLSVYPMKAKQNKVTTNGNDITSFAPFPKAGDKYWLQQVPEAMRNDYINQGELYLDKSWEKISDEAFAEFRTNGNRTHYEALSFDIRKQFACLVMAEIMEGKGRFLPTICRGLHYFMEQEPWWGIPAHYPKAKPERDIQPVDLFNAETSDMLAWTLYMLDKQIDKQEKGLCNQVRNEIERRFLHPTLYEKQGWKHNANNWNTWITTNWLQTLLICYLDDDKHLADILYAKKHYIEKSDDKKNDVKKQNSKKYQIAEDFDAACQGIKECLQTFMKGYPNDGGCEEGVSYWDCAGASFFESLFFMQFAPEEARLQLNEAQQKKVEAMGRFITTMYINDLNFVNFSDAQAQNVPNINILFPYGEYLKNEPMMQLAAYVGKKYQYQEHPTTLFLKSGNYPKLGRELMLLSMLGKYKQTAAVQPKTEDAYLENSQIMVARNEEWLVAAKGGNNAESHNHNDIGNFVIYHNHQPIVIDLGRDTYTAQSFSNKRFELMNCRSAYHNVPIINGIEQKDGKQYRASEVSHQATTALSSIQMNIEKAYPQEAHVDAWQRTITLDRAHNWVEITEQYQLDSLETKRAEQEGKAFNTPIILMVYGMPEADKPGSLLLQDGAVRLEYDALCLSATFEKVEMADGIMKTQWHDNVYRILLYPNDYASKVKTSYRFVNTQ